MRRFAFTSQDFIHLYSPVFVGDARMIEVSFEIVRAFNCGVDQARAIPAESLEEDACVAAVLGTCSLISRVECPQSAVRPEIRSIPERHQPEYASADMHLTRWAISFQQMQFLESLEYPEGEIDIDAERIKNLAFKLVGQSFA